jgi:hypothetical protein
MMSRVDAMFAKSNFQPDPVALHLPQFSFGGLCGIDHSLCHQETPHR